MTDSTSIYNSFMAGNSSFRKVVGTQVDQMIKAQTSALSHLEGMTEDWYERRKEALESLADCLKRASEATNAADVWSIYANWTSEELSRLSSDFSSLTQRATAFGETARDATANIGRSMQEAGAEVESRAREAAGKTVEAFQDTAKTAKRAAGQAA